jgi:hypothetical protein
MTPRPIALCSRRTCSRIGLLPIFSTVVGTLTARKIAPPPWGFPWGRALNHLSWKLLQAYKNIGWGWEAKNHFLGKGKIEGESDQTSLLQCRLKHLCWGSFELDCRFVNNKGYEERKKVIMPPIFPTPPPSGIRSTQQGSL